MQQHIIDNRTGLERFTPEENAASEQLVKEVMELIHKIIEEIVFLFKEDQPRDFEHLLQMVKEKFTKIANPHPQLEELFFFALLIWERQSKSPDTNVSIHVCVNPRTKQIALSFEPPEGRTNDKDTEKNLLMYAIM